MKLLVLGRAPGQRRGGKHWGGSAGKAGERCDHLHYPVHYTCSCVRRARRGRKSNKAMDKRKMSEVLEGKRREGTGAGRDQRVNRGLRGTKGIGQEERNGSREHQQGKGSKDAPGVCWSQGRVRNNSV